jgi:hypothetical protein
MQNAVRDYGIRAVTQALCRSEEEVRAFWASLVAANNGGYCKCVVKPNESAGSDGVYLCETVEEALRAFSSLHGHFNGLGQVNDGALCQASQMCTLTMMRLCEYVYICFPSVEDSIGYPLRNSSWAPSLWWMACLAMESTK